MAAITTVPYGLRAMRDPSLVDLPEQEPDVPFPREQWPRRDIGSERGIDGERLAAAMDTAFERPPPELGTTHAVVVVHRGALVAERYGTATVYENDAPPDRPPGAPTADTALISWSMAKSMLHAMVGRAVGAGLVDINQPVPVPEWTSGDDPRCAITWDHLLHMAGGQQWEENYTDPATSDALAMLFGEGADDMAAYAAAKPLVERPGHTFVYSSGTSNLLARSLQAVFGVAGDPTATAALLRRELFDPLGMATARARFDAAGTWIASSFVDASALDFARFGLLYLRDGVWEGRRLLPEGWVDHARTPTEADPLRQYGAHWWVWPDGFGSFSADGYEGQRIRCVPAADLVLVRLGATPEADPPPPGEPEPPSPVDLWLDEIVACFST